MRSVTILSNSLKKNLNKKSLEGRFQKHLQTAVKGTEHTVTTDTGKIIHRKFISDPIIFQKERKTAPKIGDTITSKNRHCLRGVDGKYIQWNEILRDVLNGQLEIIPNKKLDSDSESEEGEIEDEDSDFENPDTSERNGRYQPITTSPEDELNVHTDGELNTGEIKTENTVTEKMLDGQTGKANNRIDTGGLHILEIFGYKKIDRTYMLTGDNKWNSRKEPPQPLPTPADFTREKTPTPGSSRM